MRITAGRDIARLAMILPALLAGADAAAEQPRSYVARVVSVADGDSGRLSAGGRRFGFRLHQIDAPELAQPHGAQAHAALVTLIAGRKVRVFETATDSYGRAIVRLELNALDVNARMLQQGHAWVYTRYATDPALKRLERAARDARRGLWALPDATRVPPWRWREQHPRRPRATASVAPVAPGLAQATACGEKRYCRQMTTCAEARFHLATCAVSTLDGDGDGVPCEMLCSEAR